MFFTRLSLLRQFLAKRNCIQKKCFSSQTKSESKTKEIKDFVLNQSKWDSNASDLKKSVLIYANENTQFYRRLFLLNVVQCFFWMIFANQGIALIMKKPKTPKAREEDKELQPQKELFSADASVIDKVKVLWQTNKTQVIFSVAMVVCGQISMSLFALFAVRSVRYIILKPGGQSVRITTFSITGSPNRYRHYDVPLDSVSAFQYRNTGVSYIPLKLKKKWFFFLVDSKGHFYKPSLFDQTVGVFRVLK